MTTPASTPSPLANDQFLRDVPEVDGWKVLAPAVLYAKIGQGGMGAVYRGRHLELEIDVAVKCLRPSLVAEDEQFEARFRREARIAAELTHENLVRLYELRRAHGLSYLILEFVEGETARDRVLRKGPLREEEAATIVLAATRGLAKAHRHREVIVHRDIKPENILISKRGEVKLADLGLAKALEGGVDNTLTTQGVIGTPAYMAPEQWDDQKQASTQTDVWAMGVTLYFLLTGRNAMRGATPQQVYNEVVNREFPDPRALRPDLSPELVRILQRCTQKKPEQRYPDASALAEDLQDFLGGRSPSLLDRDSGTVKLTPLLSPPPEHALQRMRATFYGNETQPPPPPTTKPAPAPRAEQPLERAPLKSSSKRLLVLGGVMAIALAVVAAIVMNRPSVSPDGRGGEEGELSPGPRTAAEGAGAQPPAIERDSTGPTLSSRRPADGTAVESETSLNVELGFDELLRRAQIGGRSAQVDGPRATISIPVPTGEGAWNLAWQAEDALGNATTGSIPLTRSPRRIPRIVLDLDLPADGLLYWPETRLTLRGKLENPAENAIQVTVDGKQATYALGADGAIEVDVTLPLDKRSMILVSHGSGEATATVGFDVVQDAEDPVVTFVYPDTQGLRTRADAVDLSAQVADANLESVWLGNRQLEQVAEGSWLAEGVGLAQEGLNSFTVTARDRAGRTGTATIEIVRDTTEPKLTGVQPAEHSELETEATTAIRLSFDEELASASLDGSPMSVSGSEATHSLAIPVGEGAVSLCWGAMDSVGNTATGSVAFTRKVKARVPPGWEIVDATAGFGGWARKVREPKSQIVFVLVAPGSFRMGSPKDEVGGNSGEQQHQVQITKPFYLAETETTQEQYELVTRAAPSYYKGSNLPVEQVDWNESRQFCRTIECDLPTEAQWEYACRAGTTTPFSFGSMISPSQANSSSVSVGTTAAKSFGANAWGLFDMHGNVFEWCLDGYRSDHEALPGPDPHQPPSGNSRVLRGGSFGNSTSFCRSAFRSYYMPTLRALTVGFRAARTLP